MEVRELTIMVGTDQINAMTRFYGDTLELERMARFRDPVFAAAGGFIRLLDHSEISGPTQEPERMQINLFVDDVSSEFSRVISTDPEIRVHREPERESWGGEVATLLDPDGNFVQLLELVE
ncbi:MAG: hypothetical protein OXH38_05265 [Chloroflexi bacterium]|nr:hypothetical protein [Chloroflexota bacterium]